MKKKNKEVVIDDKIITGEGEIRSFAYLRQGAKHFLQTAEEMELGKYYNLMSSMLFCAFSLEAYVTHLGEKLLKDDWEYFKRLNPVGKLKLLDKILNLKIDCFKSPFSVFADIFSYRNKLVHGKTETVSTPSIKPNKKFPVEFETKWQKITTIKTAKRFVENTELMMNWLYENTKIDELPPDCFGMSSYTAKIRNS